MADLVITAGQVLKSGTPNLYDGIAGEALTQGMACYISDATTSTVKKAQSDGTVTEATVKGFALNAASTGQPVQLQCDGTIVLGAGAAPVQGTTYYASVTAGGVTGDVPTSGKYVSIVGVGAATATTGIIMKIHNSGVTVP
jgi:hypothetical protein